MRFTIRDLLWLTVVLALVLAWWLDRSRLAEMANLADAINSYKHGPGDYAPGIGYDDTKLFQRGDIWSPLPDSSSTGGNLPSD
jgi:hypothetical protein